MPKVVGSDSAEGVQAVVLTLRILEYMSGQRDAVGVTVLAHALNTTKSRIYRHVRTLVQQGYLVQEASEKYSIGARLVALGREVSQNVDLINAANGAMTALRDALGHAVVLTQIEAEGVRVLAKLPGTSDIEIGVKNGSLLGFHYTAQGRTALAFGPDELRTRVFRSRLEMKTPKTIVGARALRSEIERIRRQGWATAPNEAAIGLNALAAPVFDAGGQIIGAVAIVDSIQFIEEEPTDEQIRRTVAAGRRISAALGYVESKHALPPPEAA